MNNSLESYIASLQKESDRGCVLIGADLLACSLEEMLSQKMQGGEKLREELLTGTGPISTFSAKIKVAYTFNLISANMFSDLEKIRKIRNFVAHSFTPFSFEDQAIEDNLNSLKMLDLSLQKIETLKDKLEEEDALIFELFKLLKSVGKITGRGRFNYTVALLYGYLDKNT